MKGAKQRKNTPQVKRFIAGCERVKEGPADLREVAYTELAFPECPTCPHRVIPEGAPSFCRWLPVDAKGPFAGLESFAQGLDS